MSEPKLSLDKKLSELKKWQGGMAVIHEFHNPFQMLKIVLTKPKPIANEESIPGCALLSLMECLHVKFSSRWLTHNFTISNSEKENSYGFYILSDGDDFQVECRNWTITEYKSTSDIPTWFSDTTYNSFGEFLKKIFNLYPENSNSKK